MLGIANVIIGELTAGQLEGAAADLRNSSLVVKHAGHFRSALVDRRNGSVCALAAIQLATYKKLVRISISAEFVSLTQSAYANEVNRAHNAVMLLADTLPGGLCEGCAAGLFDFSDDYDAAGIVTHYNDAHCASGEVLMKLLDNAADRAMTLAAERRSLVHGRPLVGV